MALLFSCLLFRALLFFFYFTKNMIGHCIQHHDIFPRLNSLIYTFHMPAFIFLAGMFHKNERIIPKAVSYLCIYFVLKLGLFVGNLLISEVDGPFLVFKEGGPPWFMFVLAGYTAASYILRDIDKRFLLLVAGALGCFAIYDQTIGSFLMLGQGFLFYPFYILGELCSPERLASVSRKPALRLAGGAVLAGWAALCFVFPGLLQPLFGWGGALGIPWGPLWRALHYGVSVLLCFSLVCVVPDRRLPVVTAMGGRTLQIYFWHMPAVRVIEAVTGIGAALCATGPGRAAYILFCVAVTFLAGTRPFSFPTDHILYFTGVRRKRPLLLPKEKTGLS